MDYTAYGNNAGVKLYADAKSVETYHITLTDNTAQHGNDASTSGITSKDSTVAYNTAATYSYTVAKPVGAAEWTVTVTSINNTRIAYTDSDSGSGTLTTGTPKTLTSDSVNITITRDTTTQGAPTVAIATAATAYALTTSEIGSVVKTGGISGVTWALTNADEHNGTAAATVNLNVNLGATTTTDTQVVVKYKVTDDADPTAMEEKTETHTCTAAQLQTIELAADNGIEGDVEFQITEVYFQVKVAYTAASNSLAAYGTNPTTAVKGTVLGVAEQTVADTGTFVDYGTTVKITLTGATAAQDGNKVYLIGNANVNLDNVNAPNDGNASTALELSFVASLYDDYALTFADNAA